VAIIDTGILPNHEDIVGSPNLVPGYDMISDPFTAHDGDGRDVDPTDPGDAVAPGECSPTDPGGGDSWHGTHVAGTVGVGNTDNGVGVAGVNWATKVQAVRVLGKCGGTTADIVDAIRWAAGLSVPGVPNNSTPARVINMSLGGQPGFPCSGNPATQSAINDAVGAGAVVVVAAGNDAVDAATVSPASCENVITVAASDYRGHLASRYSNFGETIEIMAPGGDVRRDDNGDQKPDGVLSMVKGGYAYYNGTSMAAPHVSGVAALYMAEDPEMQLPGQVLARLKNDAILRNSTQCPNPCGAGLLSAFKKETEPINGDKELMVIPALPPPTGDSISQGGEKDWFTFSVATQGQHKIETFGGTDVKMALFGPGNKTTKIANDDDSGQGYNAKISTLLAPGTYFVEVQHFSPTGTGKYSIAVQAE
jgi:serine protease